MRTLKESLEEFVQSELGDHFNKKNKGNPEVVRQILSRNNPVFYPEYYFTFGRHIGKDLETVAKQDLNYLIWLVDQEFIQDQTALFNKIKKSIELARGYGS